MAAAAPRPGIDFIGGIMGTGPNGEMIVKLGGRYSVFDEEKGGKGKMLTSDQYQQWLSGAQSQANTGGGWGAGWGGAGGGWSALAADDPKATKGMKAGGLVRGGGSAVKGRGRGRMV